MKAKSRSLSRRVAVAGKRPPLDPELMSLMSLVQAGRFADVEALARRILAKRPDQPLALKALSFALVGLARYEEALTLLDYAIPRQPQDAELHNNQGIALSMLMRWEDSIVSFQRARQLTPDDPEVLKNMGAALLRMHRWNDAVPILLQAIEKHPGDYAEAISLLADCLSNAHRIDEAWTCFRELYANDDTNLYVLFQLISVSLKRCHWDELPRLIDLLREKSRDFAAPLSSPFWALAFPGLDGVEHRRVAEGHSRNMLPAARPELPPPPLLPVRAGDGHRLRIAYISGDFRRHAVGLIIPEVIERHDRSRVEVYAYSTTADDGSSIHQRLSAAFDRFVDVTDFSVEKLVQRIRADDIDVLIDLSGWTSEGRPEALALRCAPVQVNWLGYAGTMGDGRVADYIIGDPVATPLEHAGFYAERIMQLPHCYLPADATRPIGARPSRVEAGLPESAFVFCSFNNSYKFNPTVFDLWCSVLARAPDSVLWLTHPRESGADNLRKEFGARGIDVDRLIFARRVDDHADHLARMQLADLALDPFPYNSHSTGVDTLWAGVPMVALKGTTFAGRVGASLLTAVGLPELIVENQADYARLALALYADRARLAALHERLRQARATTSLFDMARFTKNLEDLYFEMARRATADGESREAAGSAVSPHPGPGQVS